MSTTALSNIRPSDRPFLPEDKLKKTAGRAIYRLVAAGLYAKMQGGSVERAAEALFPTDAVTLHVVKAATSPATISATGWAAELAQSSVAEFISSLAPQSAAARLIELGTRVSLDGRNTVLMPTRLGLPSALPWISESGAIPVVQRSISTAQLGPAKKMAVLAVFSEELGQRSAIEEVVKTVLMEDAGATLEASIFSNVAASSTRPAGLLNGVTTLTATAGGGLAALSGDIQKLIVAITTAGGGTGVVLVMHPARAAALSVYANNFAYPVLPSRAIAADAIVAIDSNAFVSGFSPTPQIDISTDGVLHLEDTTPLAISTAGTPNTVAAPVTSLFQTGTVAVRLMLDASWTLRAAQIAHIASGVTW